MNSTVEILNGLNAGSIINISNQKAAEALVNDYIYISKDKYIEIGRSQFYDKIVIHYVFEEKNSSKKVEARACIDIANLITYNMESYSIELLNKLLAKSLDNLGIDRKKIAEYLDIKKPTLSNLLNHSLFKQENK